MASISEQWGDAVAGAPWSTYLRPAPGDLRIVQAFVNTATTRPGSDELDSPPALAEYLARWGLLAPATELSMGDLERAIEVREGLRSLAAAKNRQPIAPEAMENLDRGVADSLLRVRFDRRGTLRLAPAGVGLDGALGRLVQIVAQANFSGLWIRFKACAGEGCSLAFYDYSRNRTARWCSMERCGNKIKTRAWRKRHPQPPKLSIEERVLRSRRRI